jgi:hypothetical protein
VGLHGRKVVRKHVETFLSVKEITNPFRKRWPLARALLDRVWELGRVRRGQTDHW